jgi:hypothetical protein
MHPDRSHCNFSSVPVTATARSARALKCSADMPENGKTSKIYVPVTKYIEEAIQSGSGESKIFLQPHAGMWHLHIASHSVCPFHHCVA